MWSKPTQFSSTIRRAFWKASSKERPMPMTSPGGTGCKDWGPGGRRCCRPEFLPFSQVSWDKSHGGSMYGVSLLRNLPRKFLSLAFSWPVFLSDRRIKMSKMDIGILGHITVYHSDPTPDRYPLNLLYSNGDDTVWDLSHPFKLLDSLDNRKMTHYFLDPSR